MNGTLSVNHRSVNNKFNASVAVNYSFDKNNLFNDADLMLSAFSLAPNAPAGFDSTGKINALSRVGIIRITGFRRITYGIGL